MENLQYLLNQEKEKNALLLEIINAIPQSVASKDTQGNFTFLNQLFATKYNTIPDNIIGKKDTFVMADTEQDHFLNNDVQDIAQQFDKRSQYQSTHHLNTDNVLHFNSLKTSIKENKSELNIAIMVKHVTEQKLLQDTAENNAKRLKHVLEVSQEGMWDWHTQTDTVLHNSEWERITGVKNSDNSFQEFQHCLFEDDKSRVNKALNALLEFDTPYDIEFRIQRPDGQKIWIWDRGQVIERDANGNALWVVGIMQDVTQAKHAQAKINYMAFYDSLTNIPNRSLLENRLKSALQQAKDSGKGGAVLFIDLDQFKVLNDTHGHQSGDSLLIEVAKRIHKRLKVEDTVARFGGDEFVVVLNNLSNNPVKAALEAESVAADIRQKITQPILIKTNKLLTCIDYKITASIGISLFGNDERDPEQLLQLADLALYQAKENGRDDSIFFNPAMQQKLNYTIVLEKALREAVSNNHFILYF